MNTNTTVQVWEETITLPTYKAHAPEKNPIFIENRAYQGSSGRVYPLPVTEKIDDTKVDMDYKAIFIENDFLKIMVLPELGGRIQRAYDKTNDYDFVYYNHVIKPALVGLTGPWISGGIEFNWPQHHRPSTYSPVDYSFTQNADGSATVSVSEIDKMYGTKGMGSFTLYPDKSYIEIKGQLFNNTDTPQTFLWWANPAVPVNDNTYSVFPPDVHAVMDHGKRAVSTFPIATGEYYKYDYSDGIDISMYKNVKVPTSYMAASSEFNFIGNYDSEVGAGLLHVADHHISPGKKQWTWGNADFGRAWDRNLTDEDGPYIELMTGVFADNQPDFTWLKPYEEKTFTQYFMPYKGVGRVKNATKDAMVDFDVVDGDAYVSLYTSGVFHNITLTISYGDDMLFTKTMDTTPETFFEDSFAIDFVSPVGCTVTVTTETDSTLVSYTAVEKKLEKTPDPADPLGAPADLKTTEELFLGAQHLEQYRHATYEPAHYYEEGLRRDPSDMRLNNGYGMLQLKRGNFELAKKHFTLAVEKQTRKNPNPYYGECYFNLGLSLFYLGEINKAFDAFYKATWSNETQCSGFYWLALISCQRKEYSEAMEFVNKSMIYNWHNMKARTLKLAIMRKLGLDTTAVLAESLAIDPLYMGCNYEAQFISDTITFDVWKSMMREDAHNYLVLALDYIRAGLTDDALVILAASPDSNPLVSYYKGYAYLQANDTDRAIAYFTAGETEIPDYCFPNKIDEILILNAAIACLEKAPFAHYYLGNIYYDKRQYADATCHWETSIAEDDTYPMSHRNLAIAYFNKEKDNVKALATMRKAFALDETSPRFLMELNQLLTRCNVPIHERLELLVSHLDLVMERDVLCLEYVILLNLTEQYDKALELLNNHTFHPWEGGEGRVSLQYRYALTEKAIMEMNAGNYDEAITLLIATLTYPDNLGEGKLPNTPDNVAYYYIAKCYDALNQPEAARKYYMLATSGATEPSIVLYYNDQSSDIMLYQGLAHLALGNSTAAKRAFHQLKAFGERHIFDVVTHDYFAVSLPELDIFPEDMQLRNELYCEYLMALSAIGLNDLDNASKKLDRLLEKQAHYQGAIQHLKFIK